MLIMLNYLCKTWILSLSLSPILVKQHKAQVESIAVTGLQHQLSSMPYAFKQNGGRGRGWDRSFISVFAIFPIFLLGFGYFAFAFFALRHHYIQFTRIMSSFTYLCIVFSSEVCPPLFCTYIIFLLLYLHPIFIHCFSLKKLAFYIYQYS